MRRTDAAGALRDSVRRAAAWHAPRPADESLRDLADLLLNAIADDLLPRVVHRLGAWSRYATPATAANNLIADQVERGVRGGRALPPVGSKALAFQRSWSSRASWAWLACR